MGKSALLQTVAGIQRPRSGELRLFGQAIAGLKESELLRERLRLSLVFEGGGRLFGHLTVAENVGLPYFYHHNCSLDAAQERLRTVLEATDLIPYFDCLPAQVPRALCSRIGLARALITGPAVLLLDNPSRGLDVRERSWWLAMMKKLSQDAAPCQLKPLTVVVATDDLKPWLDLGNRFALIHQQSWRAIGDRQALEASKEPLLHDLLALTHATG
jgi:phospholipid/cholesterol/gamma-HCH transport system ATP-binding protein